MRRMRSKSDLQYPKPQSPDFFLQEAQDSKRVKRLSFKSRLRLKPSLKSRISNPELRSDFQQTTFYDGMESLSISRSTPESASQSQRQSLVERVETPTASYAAAEVVFVDYGIAPPRLSPMEYARINLIDAALAKKNSLPANFPKLDKEWYWTPKWEAFIIVPRTPVPAKSRGSCTKPSTGLIPIAGPITHAFPVVLRAENLLPDTTCPRLSLNLGGMTALFPSIMNFANIGHVLLRHQASVRANSHLSRSSSKEVTDTEASPIRPTYSNEQASKSNSPSTLLSVSNGRVNSAPARSQTNGQNTTSANLIQNSYSTNPLLPGSLSPTAQFPIAPGNLRLTPSVVARQIIRRAGGHLHAHDELRKMGTLVRGNSTMSMQVSSENFSLSESSEGESGLQPAPLRLTRQRSRQNEDISKDGIGDDSREPRTPKKRRPLSEVVTPSSLQKHSSVAKSPTMDLTAHQQSGLTPRRRQVGKAHKAIPDSPTLPASDDLVIIPDKSVSLSSSDSNRRYKNSDFDTTPPSPPLETSTRARAKQLLLPFTPEKIRSESIKRHEVSNESNFALHKAKSHDAFTLLPKLGMRKQTPHKNSGETQTHNERGGSRKDTPYLDFPKRTTSRDHQVTQDFRQLSRQNAGRRTPMAKYSRTKGYGKAGSPNSPSTHWQPFDEEVLGSDTPSPWYFVPEQGTDDSKPLNLMQRANIGANRTHLLNANERTSDAKGGQITSTEEGRLGGYGRHSRAQRDLVSPSPFTGHGETGLKEAELARSSWRETRSKIQKTYRENTVQPPPRKSS